MQGSHEQHLEQTRRYYDEFAQRYDDRRGGNVAGGYHDLLDDLEIEFLQRFAHGRRVLEVGCGTGLLLQRIAGFASSCHGVDLSSGMLARARDRGLAVTEASATELPFDDGSFDVACSFKVLAHVREIERALREMLRVVAPGGTAVAEFYNPWSLRWLAKRLGPAGAISDRTSEDAVFTRFDRPRDVERMLPAGCYLLAARGIRIITPAARLFELPLLGPLLHRTERGLCDTPLSTFGGFWVAAIRKRALRAGESRPSESDAGVPA